MGWLDTLFQKGRSKDDNAAMTRSFFYGTVFQPVEFHVINELDKPINIAVFNEDPEEIGLHDIDEDEEMEDDDDSDHFNGCEPLSLINNVLPGQEWTYRRTCPCMDCQIGTIKVDTVNYYTTHGGEEEDNTENDGENDNKIMKNKGGKSFFVNVNNHNQQAQEYQLDVMHMKTLNDEETINFDLSLRGTAWKEEEENEIMTIEVHKQEDDENEIDNEQDTAKKPGLVMVDLILHHRAKKELKNFEGQLPAEVNFSQFLSSTSETSTVAAESVATTNTKRRSSDASTTANRRSSDASVLSFATHNTSGTVTTISDSTRSRRGRNRKPPKHSRRRMTTTLADFLQTTKPPPNTSYNKDTHPYT